VATDWLPGNLTGWANLQEQISAILKELLICLQIHVLSRTHLREKWLVLAFRKLGFIRWKSAL
jgi:hypothetical protein